MRTSPIEDLMSAYDPKPTFIGSLVPSQFRALANFCVSPARETHGCALSHQISVVGFSQLGDIVGAGMITFGDEGVSQEQLFYA